MKNRLISKVLTGVGIVATLVVLYAVEPVLHPAAHAENGRIVTIYHDGQQQVIATDAKTVGEALDRAGINLDQKDAVEPAKDTKLVAQNYDVNVYRARPVIVVDGAQRYRIISPYQSAKKIAESAGLQVYDEDSLTISRIDDFVAQGGAGLMLTIKRSIPVHIMLYGKLVDIRTQATTIAELMKEKGVTLGAQDGVSPAVGTTIATGMTIDVYRNGEQTVSEDRDVDFTTKQIQDADQPQGYKQVQTPGVKGKKIVTYQIELKNGQEVSRKEIQSVVTVAAKEQVEVVGTKYNLPAGSHQDWMDAAGIASGDYGFVDYIMTREGGWCPTKWQGEHACDGYHGVPASGGYGIAQATPGIKMSSAGADWATNPITQLRWATSYAVGRYGSWQAAYNHWLVSHNW
jgi:uncharacterized protein YabE (DUF348 family)